MKRSADHIVIRVSCPFLGRGNYWVTLHLYLEALLTLKAESREQKPARCCSVCFIYVVVFCILIIGDCGQFKLGFQKSLVSTLLVRQHTQQSRWFNSPCLGFLRLFCAMSLFGCNSAPRYLQLYCCSDIDLFTLPHLEVARDKKRTR